MIKINSLQKIRIFNQIYRFVNKRKTIKRIIDVVFLKAEYRTKKIVTVKLIGGLGNQLFEIAIVLAYSWKYSLTPILEKTQASIGRIKPRPIYWNTIFQKIPVSKQLPHRLIVFNEKDFNYHKIPRPALIENFNLSNGIIFNGYFQSAKYFDEFRERLLSYLFIIEPSEKEYLKKKYPEIFNEGKITISVHIRRGDNVWDKNFYQKFMGDIWDTDYYQKSFAYILKKFSSENLQFVVITDELIWAKEYMKNNFPKLNPIYPHEKDYLDLFLMSCCKHHIIANSSFSWWAAYLNNNPEKIVTAPKTWFGPIGPLDWKDVYMDNWIIIYNETNKD